MPVVPGADEEMTEGAFFEDIGLYLVVELSGKRIRRISFSKEQPLRSSEVAEKIIAYVKGRGPCPAAELDFSGFTDFRKKVTAVVQEIPRGRTLTYGEVAVIAGHPRAARAVGHVMAANPFAVIVPCHRVVARQGMGGYFWGTGIKKKLLELEASAKSEDSG